VAAVVIVAAGLFLLAGRANGPEVWAAVAVAATIGVYSVSDAHGIRSTGTAAYVFAGFICTMATTTAFGLATGRGSAMITAMRTNWQRYVAIGVAATITYGMVQLAFERAPVGYVTALRESGVVLAAFAGTRMLHEPAGGRRLAASGVVLTGLILLVIAR
jgi:drug/metabolite transporter (DMT)-like permease